MVDFGLGGRTPRRPRPTAPRGARPVPAAEKASELVILLLLLAPMRASVYDPTARARAESLALKWAGAMFTPAEVREWLEAGLAAAEVELAWELREVKITADVAATVIRGESVLHRVRAGELSMNQIVRMLQREGLLAS